MLPRKSTGTRNVALKSRLPPTFTSFYRLFLRATSAAVLHQPRSTRCLRRIWRPTFDSAADVVHKLQSHSQGSGKRTKLEAWLKLWDTRMDSTLNLLYSSSQTRGLSHELTGNMSHFQYHHLKWAQHHHYAVSSTWRPSLDPSSPVYLPKEITTQKERSRIERKRRQAVFDRNGWGALGEVVRMAEGRDGILLGRVTMNERKA